ncbi:hypothetical protein GCM10009555_101430 [Acrocarpospora macrocephala]|uniref:Secreted protein n=1 Tax=Acrocarpospora macrocephala TaxID=150177 RepID=A0A5M3WDC4_9ACTN|nr:hypothetical protein [Acrocarpospora macrocephala]GES07067.1 hypothetical protein Amac_006620 [Acrocarpospora macrocephala]
MNSLLKKMAAVGAAAFTALVVTAGPASAASAWCRIVVSSCSTGAIPPSSDHKIYVEARGNHICAGGWKVYDTGNGALVGSGVVPYGQVVRATIPGLYGRYYLKINGCLGHTGTISN